MRASPAPVVLNPRAQLSGIPARERISRRGRAHQRDMPRRTAPIETPAHTPRRRAGPPAGPLRAARSAASGSARVSALRQLTRRRCSSAANVVSVASSAARPRREHRSVVGPQGRPPDLAPRVGLRGGVARAMGLSSKGLSHHRSGSTAMAAILEFPGMINELHPPAERDLEEAVAFHARGRVASARGAIPAGDGIDRRRRARQRASSTDSPPLSERREPQVSVASSAARPRREHRSAVGPQGRLPDQAPRAGLRGGVARAMGLSSGSSHRKSLNQPTPHRTGRRREAALAACDLSFPS